MISLSKLHIGTKTILIISALHSVILILLCLRATAVLSKSDLSLFFWLSVCVSFTLYLKTSLTDPGYWPIANGSPKPSSSFVVLAEEHSAVDQENIVTIKDENTPAENVNELSKHSLVNSSKSEPDEKEQTRFCTNCKMNQPLRTKHCRDCCRCVAMYDHHCPWIGGCVGQNNKIYFFWYVLAQSVEIWVAGWFCLKSFESADGIAEWVYLNVVRVAVLLVLAMFGLMVSCLLGFHCYLAVRNYTTWEFLSWGKIEYLKHRSSRVSPFSKGCFRNLKEYCCERFPPFKQWEVVNQL